MKVSELYDWDYDPETYPRMGQLLKKKRESADDAGIFEIIEDMYQYDFLNVSGQLIDRMFWSRVALRSPSPIVVNTKESEGERLTYAERLQLAMMMYSYFAVKWDKQKAVVSIEYDPIHNYMDEWSDTSESEDSREGSGSLNRIDGSTEYHNKVSTRTDDLEEETTYDTTEERTDDITKTKTLNTNELRTDNLSENKTYGKTSTRTDNLTKTDSGDNGTKEEQIYAFNSISYQPSNKEIHTGWGGNTEHNTGTQGTVEGGGDGTTNTGTQNTANTGTETVADTGTQTNTKDGSETVANTGTQTIADSEDRNRTDTRSDMTTSNEAGTSSRERSGLHTGNIGNLTSQKMISEEIALWKWNFIEEILSDATRFLTLQVYC